MQDFLRSLWQDESGQDLAEYAMLLVLIAIVVLAALGPLGDTIKGAFQKADSELFTPES